MMAILPALAESMKGVPPDIGWVLADFVSDPTALGSNLRLGLAVEAAYGIPDIDERLRVLEHMGGLVRDRRVIDAAIEAAEDKKYGERVLETLLADLSRMADRMLHGKNPAVVVRTSEWEWEGEQKIEDIIPELLGPVGVFAQVGEEKLSTLPSPAVPFCLRLSNFMETGVGESGFPYTLSAARVGERVLFLAGLAEGEALISHPAVPGVEHPYSRARKRL